MAAWFYLIQQEELAPVGVLIHGGDKASNEGESWRVPKRDLVGVLQVLLQTERLKVAGKLKLGPGFLSYRGCLEGTRYQRHLHEL